MERLCRKNSNGFEVRPLQTYFVVEMESLKKWLPGDGIKDGLRDGLKDGIKLSKNQKEILRLVLQDKNITQEALAEKVGISPRNIEKRIAELKEKGILKRRGSRKSGYWEIESIEMESLKEISGDGLKDGIRDGIKLSKNQQEILRSILQDKNITQEVLTKKVGISARNIEKRISELKEKGILKRIGSCKSGYWEIESIEMESLKEISGDGLKDGINNGKYKRGKRNGPSK